MMRTRGSRLGLLWILALAGLMLAAGGCEPEPYLSGYSYLPRPGVYEVKRHGAEQQAPPLTVLVTVLGIRRPDPDHHVAPAVDMRMRFECNGSEPASFDPATLELVTGTLRPFPRPYATPPTPFELAAGQSQSVSVSVPFPPNTAPQQMNLNELRLRWLVHVAGYPVSQTALFERVGGSYDAGDYQPAPAPSFDLAF
jgi:hypothetical protein